MKKVLAFLGYAFIGAALVAIVAGGVWWYVVNTPVVYKTYPGQTVVGVLYTTRNLDEIELSGDEAREWFHHWKGGYSLTWVGPRDR